MTSNIFLFVQNLRGYFRISSILVKEACISFKNEKNNISAYACLNKIQAGEVVIRIAV